MVVLWQGTRRESERDTDTSIPAALCCEKVFSVQLSREICGMLPLCRITTTDTTLTGVGRQLQKQHSVSVFHSHTFILVPVIARRLLYWPNRDIWTRQWLTGKSAAFRQLWLTPGRLCHPRICSWLRHMHWHSRAGELCSVSQAEADKSIKAHHVGTGICV